MSFEYLDHAKKFVDQWDALPHDATDDEIVKVMYDDWLILPTRTIGDHVELRLVEEGYISCCGDPEQGSKRLVVEAAIELLEETPGLRTPRIPLEDMIVQCFRYAGGFWEAAEEVAELIRRAVEAGISRGMNEFDVEGVHKPRG
jgi:hypothetical protein